MLKLTTAVKSSVLLKFQSAGAVSLSTICTSKSHYSAKPSARLSDAEIIRANASVDTAISSLRDNLGSKRQRIRVGRGQASRRPTTAGRGLKGQRARTSGNNNLGFEGGQTTHWKSVRKHGFSNATFARTYALVNLSRLQFWIETGRIDATKTITMKTLFDSGCAGKLRRTQVGVKILGNGAESFKQKVDIEVSQASTKALDVIKKNGGSVTLLHYNKIGMKYLVHPEKFQLPPYLPPAPAKINNKLKKPMGQPSNELYLKVRSERRERASQREEEKERKERELKEKILEGQESNPRQANAE